MEDNETIENMLSRFQTLVTGLKVLNKEYSIIDHVKKIIRSLPKRWRPMATALKLSKDLNNTYLEELVSYLRGHEIELEEYETKRKRKIYCSEVFGKVWKEKSSSSIRWRFWIGIRRRGWIVSSFQTCQSTLEQRRTCGDSESTYGFKKAGASKDITFFECKEPGHFKNECPKLKKDRPKKKDFIGNKKGLMATWDDLESS